MPRVVERPPYREVAERPKIEEKHDDPTEEQLAKRCLDPAHSTDVQNSKQRTSEPGSLRMGSREKVYHQGQGVLPKAP
jgi:hypothetical protein